MLHWIAARIAYGIRDASYLDRIDLFPFKQPGLGVANIDHHSADLAIFVSRRA